MKIFAARTVMKNILNTRCPMGSPLDVVFCCWPEIVWTTLTGCLYDNPQISDTREGAVMIRRLAIATLLALVIPSSEYAGQQTSREAPAGHAAIMEMASV